MNGPVRSCVVCRRRFAKAGLRRHVVRQDETGALVLVADPAARLPGRGYYLCGDERCAKAFQARATAHAKKRRADDDG